MYIKYLLILPVVLFALAITASDVHAIVIIPALILIPLAKIVAIVIASLTLPATSIGVLVNHLSKNKKLAVVIPIIIILSAIIISMVVLKAKFPDNPWF